MQIVEGECHKNPKKTGHCWHTKMESTRGAITQLGCCCWCGQRESTTVMVPEHGTSLPAGFSER